MNADLDIAQFVYSHDKDDHTTAYENIMIMMVKRNTINVRKG